MRSQVSSALLDYLVQKGYLSSEMRHIILQEHTLSNRSIDTLIRDLDLMDEEKLITITGELRQYPVVSLHQYKKNIKALEGLIPEDVQLKACAIPIDYSAENSQLTIALSNMSDLDIYDLLSPYLTHMKNIVYVLAKKSEILGLLHELHSQKPLQGGYQKHMESGHVLHVFLYNLFIQAIDKKASDIHFTPEKFLVHIRMRCDGIMALFQDIHESFWQPLCVQLKILAHLDIAETRKAQDGRFSLSLMGRNVDFRIATHPCVYGERLVLRILDQAESIIPLNALGYSAYNLMLIQKILMQPEGLIIMAGPTGSGKTTSLYSMLSMMDHGRLNIMTLEEPVEHRISGICQTEVKDKSALTFSSGVHSILRQDPDIILIGEVRDTDTADMVVRASMTGHLVLTTLHTTDGVNSIHRLIELGVPLSLVLNTLNGVVAQRLIRLLCIQCKKTQKLSLEEASFIHMDTLTGCQTEIWQPHGCHVCSFSGYKGRKAIAEVLVMTPELKELILNQASPKELKHYLEQQGFINLYSDAVQCILKGETSLKEVQRVLGVGA